MRLLFISLPLLTREKFYIIIWTLQPNAVLRLHSKVGESLRIYADRGYRLPATWQE
jgi:hypothetical protein